MLSNLIRMLSADVAVVGGGPAGAAAAITLARAGRDVVLVDKARFPRDKCCGDGLTTGALRLLESLGFDRSTVDSWQEVSDVIVRSPSGYEATFPLPRGQGVFAAVARRVDLDSALLDTARSAGVKVLDGHALRAAKNEPDRIVLEQPACEVPPGPRRCTRDAHGRAGAPAVPQRADEEHRHAMVGEQVMVDGAVVVLTRATRVDGAADVDRASREDARQQGLSDSFSCHRIGGPRRITDEQGATGAQRRGVDVRGNRPRLVR